MKEKDRYVRLRAIKEFGYDIDWDTLKKFSIGIIGVGGLGCLSSELVVRCGVGTVVLFDFDKVDVINLNRCMYKPRDVGLPKVEVAAKYLKEVNPDVNLRVYNKDIMDITFEETFEKELSQMDIVLNGLDNLAAREYLNAKCISLRVPYIDAGASRSGLSGYVHPIIPFKTACAACLSNYNMSLPEERGEPCVASLPSTMTILASIQVQEMLKYLLKFGSMIDYLMYNMITGEFLHYKTKRDNNCLICGKKSKKASSMKSKISKDELDKIIDSMK